MTKTAIEVIQTELPNASREAQANGAAPRTTAVKPWTPPREDRGGADVARETVDGLAIDATVATYLLRGQSLSAAKISAVDFAVDFADVVIDDALTYLRSVADKERITYDPSFRPSSSQVLVAKLADSEALAAAHATIINDDVPQDLGAASSESDGPVLAMAHVLSAAGGVTAAVYRLKGEGIATRRVRGIRALRPAAGYWEPIPVESMLYYSPKFDAAVLGEELFFTAVTTLAQRLEAPERSKTMAREAFTRATSQVQIAGAEELARAVEDDPTMRAKMAQLSRLLEADPLYAQKLTTERLVEFLDDNPQYEVKVDGVGAERRLVYESGPQQRFRIVKLLSDDLLRSDLTGRRYEATSKHRVGDA